MEWKTTASRYPEALWIAFPGSTTRLLSWMTSISEIAQMVLVRKRLREARNTRERVEARVET